MTTETSVASDGWLRTPAAVGLALAAFAGHTGLLLLLNRSARVQLVALALVFCYAVYLGFALNSGDRRDLAVEVAFIGVGLTLAGLGLWWQPACLAVGWGLHGVWDLLHHRDHRIVETRGVPVWYVPLCAFFDFPVAVSLVLLT